MAFRSLSLSCGIAGSPCQFSIRESGCGSSRVRDPCSSSRKNVSLRRQQQQQQQQQRARSLRTRAQKEEKDNSAEDATVGTGEDDFEARLPKLQRKVTSGSGNEAEARKARKEGGLEPMASSSKSVPLKDSVAVGPVVQLGMKLYVERLNGRLAALGLAAVLLIELATGGIFIKKYRDSGTIFVQAAGVLHLAVSLGLILALDKFLKQTFVAAGIKFPSALFGMFCIFTTLVLTDLVKPEAAAAFISFFQPATMFIQRWLPLFYVPSLVVIPLAVQGIPTEAAAKIALLFVGGWVASLLVAGYTTVMVRNMINTALQTPEYTPKPPPFSDLESKVLAAAVIVFFAIAVYSPTAFGTTAVTTLPFYLSVTALAYVVGTNLPANVKRVFHPIITCALSANIAAFIYGKVTGFGFESALKSYLTKQAGNPGAGDIYMGFLGSVILSFAFSMFRQRVLVKRHAAEIFSAVAVSSLFSMYSTAAAGRLIGLAPNLTLAIVPRCITVALALPIAGLLEAGNPSLTAAVVVLTGLIGANFGQALMDKLGFNDPITRGMATATSAHGLGTASLSAKEPEALPFCAIAYALTGIFCSVLVSIPLVQQSLVQVAGQAAV